MKLSSLTLAALLALLAGCSTTGGLPPAPAAAPATEAVTQAPAASTTQAAPAAPVVAAPVRRAGAPAAAASRSYASRDEVVATALDVSGWVSACT